MPYSIDRFNGTTLTVIEDGTIDTTLDIKLIGKNYAGYGEVQNENFLHMLESFSGTSPPPRPISGQIWFDSGTKKLKFYDAVRWRTTGGAEVSTFAPSGLTTGDFWWDSANDQLYANKNGTEFILIGPQGVAGFAFTGMKSRGLKDLGNVSHGVIEGIADGDVVCIINSDPEFTLDPLFDSHQIELTALGFGKIKTGITMANTGVSGITSSAHRFWGTASNALKLNGESAASYVKADTAQFTAVAKFVDPGLNVGASDDLSILIDVDGVTPIIKNNLSNTIKFQTQSAGIKTPLTLVGNDILPGANVVSNIGSDILKYNTVFALTFNGTATQSSTLDVGGTFRSASTAASPNTVAARDPSGNLTAILFQGTATSAYFADLAEKYLADTQYDVGTVVCIGGSHEVTAATYGNRAIGIVSGKPGFIMNSHLEGGTLVALKGRVPVKVQGTVKKGDKLVPAQNMFGSASSANDSDTDYFAIALQDHQSGAGVIECLVL